MSVQKRNIVTAVIPMAVTIIILLSNGCVTSRHIDELKAEIRNVEAQTKNTQDMVMRMDSVVNAGEESNAKLRTDVIMAVDEIQQQMSALLENYNDLLVQINQLGQKENIIYLPPKSSPCSQPESGLGGEEPNGTMPRRPTIDCDSAYDEGFIATRSGEYDKAMTAFDKFLAECPDHENVENAYYWYGECYYAQEKYQEAIDKFKYLIDNHKNSPKAGQALYKIARSNEELGNKKEAKKLFQQLVDDYPESLEAQQAREKLKEF